MGLIEDKYEAMMREVEDGYEDSRSGSDNYDIAADDQDVPPVVAGNKSSKRKKYHRHTHLQIQELEK